MTQIIVSFLATGIVPEDCRIKMNMGSDLNRHLFMFSRDATWSAELLQHFVFSQCFSVAKMGRGDKPGNYSAENLASVVGKLLDMILGD